MRLSLRIFCGLIVTVPYCGAVSAWAQETGISIEAVDTYSPPCSTLQHNIANVDSFRNRMLSIPGYTAGVRFTDPTVFTGDFKDPERGATVAADNDNFDRPGDAIAYFSGHGTCDDQTMTACTSTAGCPNIGGVEKRCLRFSENPLQGRCVYSRPRTIVVNNSRDLRNSCQSVNYSTNDVAWGEDPSAGSWGRAGTNGGVNFVVIDNSCGITPDLIIPELINAFAGVSTIATIMPTQVGSDTADVAGRGQAFADRYVANVNSAIAPSWTNAINSVTGGGPCAFGGGNHGIVGCGAHIAISLEVNQARAEWANGIETWQQLRDPGNDGIGQGYMAWIFTCNYDCNNHPFVLP